jgi:hypothetical protein
MATQIGIGFSQLDSPLEAGHRAAEQALEPLAGQEPDLVVLFSTTDLKPSEVLAGVRAVAGEVPLVGGCSTGVIVPQGPFRSGVAVLALRSEEIQVVADIAPGASEDPVGSSRALVRGLQAWKKEEAYRACNGLLLALVGALGSRAEAMVVEAMGDELRPLFRLVGGGARDPSGQITHSLFLNYEAHSEAVAAALFLTPGPVGVGVRHGYEPLSRPLVVTRAEGNVIYELDGRSAFQAYVDQFPDHPELTLQNFGQFALDHPLGLPQMGREYMVRDPFGARPDGALECAGMVPAQAVVRIMTGNRETMIQSAREAAVEAMQPLGGRRPLLALVFSCVSRLAYLGPAAQQEVAAIREVIGPETPAIGLFSFGEIAAQLDNPPIFQNKTVVVGVIGETWGEKCM